MDRDPLKDMFTANEIDLSGQNIQTSIGNITEKDKFLAAKQILLGLAILYLITLSAYLYKPHECQKLIDVIITILPPLATLILATYFHKGS